MFFVAVVDCKDEDYVAVVCDRDSDWWRNGSLFPQLYVWAITEQLRGTVMVGLCVSVRANEREIIIFVDFIGLTRKWIC